MVLWVVRIEAPVRGQMGEDLVAGDFGHFVTLFRHPVYLRVVRYHRLKREVRMLSCRTNFAGPYLSETTLAHGSPKTKHVRLNCSVFNGRKLRYQGKQEGRGWPGK
jgi:hypothetical protein